MNVSRLLALFLAAPVLGAGIARATEVAPSGISNLSQIAFAAGQPTGRAASAAQHKAEPWQVALSPTVRRLFDAPYNTPDDLRALRIKHGLFTPEDLTAPAEWARAAIVRGAFADPSLLADGPDAASISPLDRAEAALQRGQVALVLELTESYGLDRPMAKLPEPGRAMRIRAAALELSGRILEAGAYGAAAVSRVRSTDIENARDFAEWVRLAAAGYRIAGSRSPESDLQQLMAALGKARSVDPTEPLIPTVEAELLFDRDNFSEAQAAIGAALALCPTSAEALALLGQVATAAFEVGAAGSIADRLDELANLSATPRHLDTTPPAEKTVAPPEAAPDAKPEPDPAAAAVPAAPPQPPEPGKPTPRAQRSLFAAVIRVRAMLRLNDPDLAEGALTALEKPLQGATAVALAKVAISAVRYEFEGTQRQIDAFDAEHPGSPAAWLAAGKAMAEARQYAQAERWLKGAIERAPKWNQPSIELGLLYVQSGQDEDAQLTLERAFKLDPFNVRVDNSLRLIKDLRGFARSTSDHFIVRSKPGVDALLGQEMLPLLEAMHRTVTGSGIGLEHEPQNKTIIDLMPGHQTFAVRIAGLPRIHTIAASTGPLIAMETPREGRGHTGTYDWLRVVRHEYTHTVGLSKTSNRIPHWFTEAQAVYLEQGPRELRTAELLSAALESNSLFDFTEINLAFTRPKKQTDRAQAYAQGHWMYSYIVERFGQDAPRKLMMQYAEGEREVAAYPAVLGVSRDEFFSDFLVWARAQAISWGTLLGPDVPSVKALVTQLIADGVEIDERAPISESIIRQLLAKAPGHPQLLSLLVERLLADRKGIPDESMREPLVQLAKARPVDDVPHRHLATLELAAGHRLQAAEHLEFLDAREEYLPKYALQLAKLYSETGINDKARAKAERAVQIAPYQAEGRELAAGLALAAGDIPGARRHVLFLTLLEPDRQIHRDRLKAIDNFSPEPQK